MNLFLENYAQLAAVAAPVLTLLAMNVLLALGGERGTLLLPGIGSFEPVLRAANTVPATSIPANPAKPANDPAFHRAA